MPFNRKPVKLVFTERKSAASSHSDAVRRQRREYRIASSRASGSVYGRGRFSTGRSELKGFDVQGVNQPALPAFSAIASAEPYGTPFAGMTELNDIQQGAAFYNRIGSKVCMTSIMVRFNLLASATTVLSSVRYAIVYDRQCNGAFPAITDIFGVNGATAANNSGVNLTNRGRFLILRDKAVTIDPASALSVDVEEYCKLTQLEAEFKASGGTIGDITTGAFYLVCGTVNLSGTGTVGIVSILARIRYLD
jgi:hypothetical protein